MNNPRRNALQIIYDKLVDIQENLEAISEEEQDAFGNLPESLQNSEHGEAITDAIGSLETASGSLQEALASIEDAMI